MAPVSTTDHAEIESEISKLLESSPTSSILHLSTKQRVKPPIATPRRSNPRRHKDKSGGKEEDDVTKRLADEERHAKELRAILQMAQDRLSAETKRADTAELKIRTLDAKAISLAVARQKAEADASKAQEQLKWYRMQLETAQREILRAQEEINALDEERADAEESAVRARQTARKMVEEIKTRDALEQGRKEGRAMGLREGIITGRTEGFAIGRKDGRVEERERSKRVIDQVLAEQADPHAPPPSTTTPAPDKSSRYPEIEPRSITRAASVNVTSAKSRLASTSSRIQQEPPKTEAPPPSRSRPVSQPPSRPRSPSPSPIVEIRPPTPPDLVPVVTPQLIRVVTPVAVRPTSLLPDAPELIRARTPVHSSSDLGHQALHDMPAEPEDIVIIPSSPSPRRVPGLHSITHPRDFAYAGHRPQSTHTPPTERGGALTERSTPLSQFSLLNEPELGQAKPSKKLPRWSTGSTPNALWPIEETNSSAGKSPSPSPGKRVSSPARASLPYVSPYHPAPPLHPATAPVHPPHTLRSARDRHARKLQATVSTDSETSSGDQPPIIGYGFRDQPNVQHLEKQAKRFKNPPTAPSSNPAVPHGDYTPAAISTSYVPAAIPPQYYPPNPQSNGYMPATIIKKPSPVVPQTNVRESDLGGRVIIKPPNMTQPPRRNHQRNDSSSSDVPEIVIQPPSRPASNASRVTMTTSRAHLSPDRARDMPLPPVSPSKQQPVLPHIPEDGGGPVIPGMDWGASHSKPNGYNEWDKPVGGGGMGQNRPVIPPSNHRSNPPRSSSPDPWDNGPPASWFNPAAARSRNGSGPSSSMTVPSGGANHAIPHDRGTPIPPMRKLEKSPAPVHPQLPKTGNDVVVIPQGTYPMRKVERSPAPVQPPLPKMGNDSVVIPHGTYPAPTSAFQSSTSGPKTPKRSSVIPGAYGHTPMHSDSHEPNGDYETAPLPPGVVYPPPPRSKSVASTRTNRTTARTPTRNKYPPIQPDSSDNDIVRPHSGVNTPYMSGRMSPLPGAVTPKRTSVGMPQVGLATQNMSGWGMPSSPGPVTSSGWGMPSSPAPRQPSPGPMNSSNEHAWGMPSSPGPRKTSPSPMTSTGPAWGVQSSHMPSSTGPAWGMPSSPGPRKTSPAPMTSSTGPAWGVQSSHLPSSTGPAWGMPSSPGPRKTSPAPMTSSTGPAWGMPKKPAPAPTTSSTGPAWGMPRKTVPTTSSAAPRLPSPVETPTDETTDEQPPSFTVGIIPPSPKRTYLPAVIPTLSPFRQSMIVPGSPRSLVRPTTPVMKPNSPVIIPNSPLFRPTTPLVRPTSPSYKPTSPFNKPTSPFNMPTSLNTPATPLVRPTSPSFKPTTPLMPTSPFMKPATPPVVAEAPVIPNIPASPKVETPKVAEDPVIPPIPDPQNKPMKRPVTAQTDRGAGGKKKKKK